jgi:hypothetical protein
MRRWQSGSATTSGTRPLCNEPSFPSCRVTRCPLYPQKRTIAEREPIIVRSDVPLVQIVRAYEALRAALFIWYRLV